MEEFDKIVRERMAEGAEEVPAGLWNAVQDRLPASGAQKRRTPVILMWTRRVAPVAATAAAVVLTVLLFGGRWGETPSLDIIGSGGSEVADVPVTGVREVEEAMLPEEAQYVPSAITSPSRLDHRATPVPLEDEEESEQTVVPEQMQTPQEQSAGTAPVQTAEQADEGRQTQERPARASDWETEQVAAKSARHRTDISVFGIASANSNPGTKAGRGPMRVPAARPAATGITETGESSYLIPLSFGASIRFHLAERWAIDLGLSCTSLNRTYGGTYREVDELGSVTRSESFSGIRNSQLYLGIPINASFSIVSNSFVDFYTYAGGTVEKCVLNRHTMNGADGVTVFKDATGGAVFSAGIGLGCEFTVARHVGIYIDPSLRYYFKSGSTPKSVRTQQPLMAGLEVGLRFNLQ